jgi:hypothetical protein
MSITDDLIKRRVVKQATDNAKKIDFLRMVYVVWCKTALVPKGWWFDKRGRIQPPKQGNKA